MSYNEVHKARDVFTPNRPARLAFVDRASIEDRLVDALDTPGKQVIVYGPSGSGKTTLLTNKLWQMYPNHVTTRCTTDTSFDAVMLSAFDQLDRFYTSEATSSSSSKITFGLQSAYSALKASFGSDKEQRSSETARRVVPVQLSPQRLAEFMGAAQCCWVVEDFHKVKEPDRVKFSQILKVFVDSADLYPEVKVIAIGAVDTARQVIQYDPEMKHRVSELYVPLMSVHEISTVVEKGASLLNLDVSEHTRTEIATYSSGIAAVCHQICLNICFAMNVRETSATTIRVGPTEVAGAVNRYLEDSSDTLKAAFDKALKRERVRKYDNCRFILSALSSADHEGLTRGELTQRIQVEAPGYPASNLSRYLNELQLDDRSRLVRYDSNSGRYSFSDPLYRAYAQCLFGIDPISKDESGSDQLAGPLNELHGTIERLVSSWIRTRKSEDLRQLTLPWEDEE